MSKVTTIAIDLAKHVFEVVLAGRQGKVLETRCLKSREAFYQFIRALEPGVRVGMEVGLGAQAWARVMQERGLTVCLLPAQRVEEHRSGGKNDRKDARSEQLALQALHRARSGWVRRKTALSNQIRGLLLEHAVVLGQGDKRLVACVPALLASASVPIPERLRSLLAMLFQDWQQQQQRIATLEREFSQLARQDPVARRLMTVPGFGELTATALSCKGVDPNAFRNSRCFAAYFGIVPEQHGTGGKVRLGRMTKRGDRYLRALAISGAHAVLRVVRKDDPSREAKRLRRWRERHGATGAAVRLANRNFRIAWALLKTQSSYRKATASAVTP
jgi:transposase